MPIYDYYCKKCGKEHTVIQHNSSTELHLCPECKAIMMKILSVTANMSKTWEKTCRK